MADSDVSELQEIAFVAIDYPRAESAWCCSRCRFHMMSTGWLRCPRCLQTLRGDTRGK